MAASQTVLEDFLRKKKLKITNQRKLILSYLAQSRQHLTPEEIYRKLNRKDKNLGRATVFRTLRLLQEAGLVGKIQLADGQQVFEHQASKAHHDHMICLHCRRVIEFCDPLIEKHQLKVVQQHDFEILWHRHEIFGTCSPCRNKNLKK